MGEVQYLQLAHIYSKLSDFGGPAASVAIEDHTQGEAPQASFRQPHPQPNHQESSDNDKPDTEIEFTRIHKPPEKKLHHLTRHWLAPGEKGALSMSRLGASSSKEAEHMIRSMGQRELRDGFKKVYGSDTSSYNNNWLRRKLYEAIGTNGNSSKRGRRKSSKSQKQQKAIAACEETAVEEIAAVEALAEIAAGEPKFSQI